MDSSIEAESDYFFTLGNRIESIRAPIHPFYDQHPEIRRVTFLCWEDAWGQANLKVWNEVAQKRGIRVIDRLCSGDYSNDFRIEASRIRAKKPDAVFVGMYAERVAARLKEQGLSIPIMTNSTIMEQFESANRTPGLFKNIFYN